MNWIKEVTKSDLSEVTLDSESGQLSVMFDLSVGERGEVAEYTEVIDMDEAPEYLRLAASAFTDALIRSLKEAAEKVEDVKCLTCTGACCFAFDSVRVTRADVERMAAGGLVPDAHVDFFPEYQQGTEDWAGYVGTMKEKRVSQHVSKSAAELEATGCVNLSQNGCGIYEHRPTVCREFSPYTCGDTYEEDPRKVVQRKAGKTTLRVMTQ